MKRVTCVLIPALAAGIGLAGAEERFGVAVYPGALSDALDRGLL